MHWAGVAVAAERVLSELGLTQVEVGWLFAASLLTYSMFQLPGALIGQSWGPRRMLPTMDTPWLCLPGLRQQPE